MKALRTLKTRKTWELIETADALRKAREANELAQDELRAARTVQEALEAEVSRRAAPGALLNPAAFHWVGRDLHRQRGLVDDAAQTAEQTELAQQAHMQAVADIRYGEKKLEEHLQRLQLQARVEEDKRDMTRMDDLWLQAFARRADRGEEQ